MLEEKKMRAWAKRMIWFSIVSIAMFLDDAGDYLLGKTYTPEETIAGAIFWTLLLVIPLVMMKND